ncbi:MAG TPA: SLBB domain-containing protein [Acidobacteriaceae bacterium]|nr:SLBB domain-containing protein [Acidobacteriaceae bacterium]
MRTRFTTRFTRLSLRGVTLLALCGSVLAQQAAPPATAPISAAAGAGASDSDLTSNSATSPLSDHTSLTAGQIISILQQKPDIVVELKSLVADQLQQQGVPAQADSITDEMLLSQITTNAALRANITIWLRTRGYVSEADMDRLLAQAAAEGETDQALSSSQLLKAPVDGLSLSNDGRAAASPLTAAGQSSMLESGASLARAKQLNPAADRTAAKPANNTQSVTDEPQSLHVTAPYNLQSLRDLYTQIPPDSTRLKRFGSEVFTRHDDIAGGSLGNRTMPVDLPIGPDYVLGTGDSLTINLWGGISQSFARVIDREGKIALPEAGSLVVAGLSLQQARSDIEGALKQQYHNAQVDVTIGRLRTVRVYVVGDVQRPGAYDVSSLSTPLNALYEAGGPTSVGSLRIIRHYRGQRLIREVDLYDFLLHGLRVDDERLEAGDTLLVPPTGPQVAIFGMVKRPAIYELKGNSTLKDALNDAGGVTVAAALDHITIERIDANKERETVTLDSSPNPRAALEKIASFAVKDGDRIHVAPILPYSERAIYVEGHVVRPGKFPYRDGMQLSDVIHSYQDLLPEPAEKGEIVRLVAPDFHPETIQFDLADALIGNMNPTLQPFDTIRVLGRYEVDAPKVMIRGEVLRPGNYALSQDMTPMKLVNMAGGFKRDALLTSADLASYTVEGGEKVVSQRASIQIGQENFDKVRLKPGDILTIHQLSGWNDIGASVTLDGEVTYPGSYGIEQGERLSSVLRRAGGLRDTAYAMGAVLIRTQVRELEEKTRLELIHQIETTSASARLAPNLSGQDQTALLQAATQQQAEVLQRLKSQPASGRLVIHISADINSWANTPADIEMHSGDVLTIPKRPGFVLVSGQVYNASALTYVPGKDASWYLRRAGGTNDVANRKEIFVIRANGTVVGRRSGEWYGTDVLGTRLDPGDVIVVPQRIIGGSLFWRNLLTVAQISSSIAITAAVAGVI